MTKEELIEAVFSACGEDIKSKAGAGRIVNAVFEKIGLALGNGDEIRVAGFGSFKVKDRAARSARNPQTGEIMQVPAKRVVGFKAASALKEGVNSFASPIKKRK